jgi:hypothetical protein
MTGSEGGLREGEFKNPLTSSVIEYATFRFVAVLLDNYFTGIWI